MPAGSFLALLDDVAAAARFAAASADDIATLTVLSTKKAGGVVVDDMAVTAGGMVGVDPGRELPIVWAVAKGSIFNKGVILIPAALGLNWFAPWALPPLLVAGGLFLSFEGMEKVLHWREPEKPHVIPVGVDPVQMEKDRISGAIRTDVILSAEVVALTLAGLQDSDPVVRAVTLYAVGLLMTVGVYGIVALLVKLDDIGMHLARQTGWRRSLGCWVLRRAPGLFRGISVIGTAAMLLVGGGIIIHSLHLEHYLPVVPVITPLLNMALAGGVGMVAGWLLIRLLPLFRSCRDRLRALAKR